MPRWLVSQIAKMARELFTGRLTLHFHCGKIVATELTIKEKVSNR